MSTTIQTMTADQLFEMPDDEFRYELVKGEIRKMPPSGFGHGKVVANLTGPLTVHVRANTLGVVLGAETGFLIGRGPDTVRAPDVAFIRQERILEKGETEKFWPGAPDLAVEVLSPSDTAYEVEEKVASWLAAGVAMVWVINPRQRTIHIHRAGVAMKTLVETDRLDGQDIIPDFCCKVTDIFS